uniref:RING-type domain-containing protein n=1 Tax=Haptolina ericina TaxID=156174 RepID=A0A7S3ESI6_9EUKA
MEHVAMHYAQIYNQSGASRSATPRPTPRRVQSRNMRPSSTGTAANSNRQNVNGCNLGHSTTHAGSAGTTRRTQAAPTRPRATPRTRTQTRVRTQSQTERAQTPNRARTPRAHAPVVPPLSERAADLPRQLGVGIDTWRELVALEGREIDMNRDYDLLARLHARATMKVFTREEIDDAMPVLTLRVSLLDQCVVCMGELNEGDSVRVLPCVASHVYHADCIAQWLCSSSTCCPVDREDLRSTLRASRAC